MLPNCILNGVAKSGTTSMYHYLKCHHQIFMSERKELNYFTPPRTTSDLSRKVLKPISSAEEYESYFVGSENFKIRGEASPSYFSTPGSAANIKSKIPNAKFITTLRNPADRAFSGYLMNIRGNTAIKGDSDAFSKDKHWVKLGLYYDRLREYYDLFSPAQIKIVLLEDLRSDKKKVLEDVFEFLSVDNNYNYESHNKIHNAGKLPKNMLLHNFINNNTFIKKTVRPKIPVSIKKYAKKLESVNYKKPETMSDELRSQLNQYYKDDIDKVQALIGRSLSIWQ